MVSRRRSGLQRISTAPGLDAINSPPCWRRIIGIVGGLGPYAHVELERQILAATARRLGRPPLDQDYPEWVVSSVPSTPDRTLAVLGEGPSPLPWLVRGVNLLCGTPETPGADFAVIACNTAHAYFEDLQSLVQLPLLDMISATVEDAGRLTACRGRIGLLATTGTLQAQLYSKACFRIGGDLEFISLLDCGDGREDGARLQEHLVMEPIYGRLRGNRRMGGGIKSTGGGSGETATENIQRLTRAVQLLSQHGADIVVAACTEIPLALGHAPVSGVTLVDPLQVAADRCVAIALGERPLP